MSVRLTGGWNEILLKFVRLPDAPSPECHLLVATDDRLRNGLPQIGRTRYPWD